MENITSMPWLYSDGATIENLNINAAGSNLSEYVWNYDLELELQYISCFGINRTKAT